VFRRNCLSWMLFVLTMAGTADAQDRYKTENVIIAVMDGTAWRSTFGEPEHRFIPHLWTELRPQGTLYTHFYNNDVTITKAGHSTIATGTWQKTRNRGPRQTMPTIFDYLADEQKITPEKVWVIFGKGKYAYEPTTTFPAYTGKFTPSSEIGVGEESLQADLDVFRKVVEVMHKDQPRIVFANFGATDHTAHSGHWDRHLKAIRNQDELLTKLWETIQADPHYRDKTALFLTNDHGYHLDGIWEGFAEHGDSCEGCRHIMLLVLGPDFKKGYTVEKTAYQTDIAPTVGELLGFQTPLAHGEVLTDCFVKHLALNRKEARTEAARTAVRIDGVASGNPLKALADEVLSSHESSLAPSASSAILLWGMLSAHDKTRDERYLDFVRAWAKKNMQASGRATVFSGLVLAQLASRVEDPERSEIAAAARRMATETANGLTSKEQSVEGLALGAIFLASIAEAQRDRGLWQRASDALLEHLRGRDLSKATKAAEEVETSEARPKPGEDIVREEGKVIPTSKAVSESSDNAWMLLSLAHVRSNGLPLKGEFFEDVPKLREESLLQTYFAVKDLPGPGEIWPDVRKAALTIAAIEELQRRKDAFKDFDALKLVDFLRLRSLSPEAVPELEELRPQLRKVSAVNYNVEYGFPPYRDFDYTVDLLRLYAERASSDIERGALLLALEPHRRIPFEPQHPSPRQ
jgi:hypothetical protein